MPMLSFHSPGKQGQVRPAKQKIHAQRQGSSCINGWRTVPTDGANLRYGKAIRCFLDFLGPKQEMPLDTVTEAQAQRFMEKIFGIAEFQDGKHLPIRFECGLSTGSQRTAFSVQSFQGGASQQDQPCRCYRKARFHSRGSSTIDRNPAGRMARHDTRLPLYGRPAFGRHRYPPMEAN